MIYLSKLIASAPDDRDYPYSPMAVTPPAASLRNWVGGVEDQGRIGSCTANSVVSACELILSRVGKHRDLSRLFNYYLSREADNMLGQDGASLRTAVKVASKVGLPSEALWPYVESQEGVKPAQPAYDSAKPITRYERIVFDYDNFAVGMNAIKSAIAEGYPVVFAAPITSQWLTMRGTNQNYFGGDAGHTQYPVIGNHAMTVVGYDSQHFFVENSWGTGWGDNGIGYWPLTLVNKMFEAWVICGYDGVSVNPAIQYKSDPLSVIQWYHNIGRTDVNDPMDPNVQYWATTTDDSDKFYATVIAICHKFMKVPV